MQLLRTIGLKLLTRAMELVAFLVVTTSVLFFILRASGNPAYVLAGINSSPAQLAIINKYYGFNRSLLTQYWLFITRALRFNFGASLSEKQPALQIVLQHLPATVGLILAATLLTVVISVPAGALLGSVRNRALSSGGLVVTFTAQAIPFFVVGLVLIEIFAVKFHLVQTIGDAHLSEWILPSVTLAAVLAPRLTRIIAGSVRDELESDYVRVARAMGAGQAEIVFREVLPNALLTGVAFASTQLAYLISGTLIVEAIFAWPGIGQLLIQSVGTLDFPVVQAAVAMIATFVYVGNAVSDVLISACDPRLRR
jgi:peptide/nickel transport system permease protein